MTHTDLTSCGGCGKYTLGTIRMCPACGWRPGTPDTAPSQSADLIAEAEKIHDALIQLSMGDMSTYEAEEVIASVITTALRAAEAENARLREALTWYGEQARLARLIHSEGDAGRHALSNDGGDRARRALGGSNDAK